MQGIRHRTVFKLGSRCRSPIPLFVPKNTQVVSIHNSDVSWVSGNQGSYFSVRHFTVGGLNNTYTIAVHKSPKNIGIKFPYKASPILIRPNGRRTVGIQNQDIGIVAIYLTLHKTDQSTHIVNPAKIRCLDTHILDNNGLIRCTTTNCTKQAYACSFKVHATFHIVVQTRNRMSLSIEFSPEIIYRSPPHEIRRIPFINGAIRLENVFVHHDIIAQVGTRRIFL